MDTQVGGLDSCLSKRTAQTQNAAAIAVMRMKNGFATVSPSSTTRHTWIKASSPKTTPVVNTYAFIDHLSVGGDNLSPSHRSNLEETLANIFRLARAFERG